MLAIVKSSTSLRQTLLYNENKLKAGQATLLDAHNFWQEKEDLSLADLLHRFKNLTALNERSKANTLHISLNFHPMDDLSDKKMTKIAAEFPSSMNKNSPPLNPTPASSNLPTPKKPATPSSASPHNTTNTSKNNKPSGGLIACDRASKKTLKTAILKILPSYAAFRAHKTSHPSLPSVPSEHPVSAATDPHRQ